MIESQAVTKVIEAFVKGLQEGNIPLLAQHLTTDAMIHRYEGGRCQSHRPADFFATLQPQPLPAPASLVVHAVDWAGDVAHACATHVLGGVPVTSYFALEKTGADWRIASRSYHFEPRGDLAPPGRHAA